MEIGYFSRMLRTTPEERRFVKPKELYLSTIKRGTIADHDVYAGERTQARHIKLLDDIFVVDLMAYSRSGSRSGFLLQYAVRVDESAGS